MSIKSALVAISLLLSSSLLAGEVDVVDVKVTAVGGGKFRIDATLAHADEGWDHYANRWDVIAPDGTVLGSRELAHPHVEEQPFTRSLTLLIPDTIKEVTIAANDSVHEMGGETMSVEIPH